MRVLIADTARTRRALLRESLGKLGIPASQVEECGLGDEALKILSRKVDRIDVVLADWDLPGAEGRSLLDKVRGLDGGAGVAVVFLVYEHRRADAKEALRLGARDFLVRPLTEEDLRTKLRNLEEKQTIRRTRAASDMLKNIVSTAEPEIDLPFLMTLPSAIMKDMLKRADKHDWEGGVEILKAGAPVDALYVITVGEIELVDASGQVIEVCKTGDPFLELPFLSEQKSPALARAKTWTQGITLSRAKLAELISKHPLTSMHLSALVARKSKQAQPQAPGSNSELQGNLSSMGFADVMQLLQLGRKTGTLSLVQGAEKGGIEIESGEARHAWTPTLTGEDAFYALACWDGANFAFTSGPVKQPKSIQTPTMSLLMEAMRRHDEQKRGSDAGPDLNQLFGV